MCAMTSRERVIAAIEGKPLDRIPKYDAFWEDTLVAWQKAGLKLPEPMTITVEGETKVIRSGVDQYFGFDITPLYMDVSMRFPTGIIAEDEEMYTITDRSGYTVRRY